MSSLEQKQTDVNRKSVQEVSKQRADTRAREDRCAVLARSHLSADLHAQWQSMQLDHYAVKLQFAGRRETIPLGTANRENAAQKAREIYLYLQSNGWEETLLKFKPKSRWSSSAATTVGEFCEQVQSVWSGKAKTLGDYIRAFRNDRERHFQDRRRHIQVRLSSRRTRIVVAKSGSNKATGHHAGQDSKMEGRILSRAGSNPAKRRSASISVNSLLRQAKSLFAPGILKFVKLDIPSPFEGVQFEPRSRCAIRAVLILKS